MFQEIVPDALHASARSEIGRVVVLDAMIAAGSASAAISAILVFFKSRALENGFDNKVATREDGNLGGPTDAI